MLANRHPRRALCHHPVTVMRNPGCEKDQLVENTTHRERDLESVHAGLDELTGLSRTVRARVQNLSP